MDVRDKISEQDRKALSGLSIELRVMNNLLNERRRMLDQIVNEVKTALTPNPALYDLYLDPIHDKWELKLKSSALTQPVPPNSIRKN